MTVGSDNPFPSVLFAEHVDPSNPSAGTQRLFVDTDHVLKLIDSAGTVTTYTGASGAMATDALWDAKGDLAAGTGANTGATLTVGANDTILMADSAQSTGLKWIASQTPSTQAFSDAAAEGTADTYARGDHKHAMPANPSATSEVPTIEANAVNGSAGTTSLAVTISAAASGKRLVVVVFSNARDVNTPTCTNVTFTEVLSSIFSTTCYLSVYVGVVAGGSSGTTVTITATGSNTINATVDTIADVLTPTAGTPATVNNTDAATITGTLLGPITPTRGVWWIAAAAQVTNTTPLLMRCNVPFTSRFVRSTLASGAATSFVYGFGYAPGGEIIAWTEGGTSGADYAGGIVQVT